MNRQKWRNCRSASRLLVKASEELGEVAKEYGDLVAASDERLRELAMRNMRREIEHATFILDCLDNLVGAQLDKYPSERVAI